MAFEPLQRKSLGASVFEQIRDRILQGTIPAGERLPAERVLAEKLGVNRQAVREGLNRLEQVGLVRTHQGGATRVLDYRRTAGLELLAGVLVTARGIDTALVRSVLEMRRDLGVAVVKRCAQRKGQGVANELDATVAELGAAAGDVPRQQVLALRFWQHVVDGADNLAYRLAFNSLHAAYGEVMTHLTRVMADEVSAVADYERLAAAIVKGDETRAAKLAIAIISRGDAAVNDVLSALDRGGSP